MKCIIPRNFPLHHKLQQHHRNSILRPTRFLKYPQRKQSLYANTQTTRAVLSTATWILADVIQPKGDINVFLQTGGLMFSAYLLANFVIPSIVSKQLQQMDDSADKAPADGNSIMGEKPNEQPKKNRGFNSPKP